MNSKQEALVRLAKENGVTILNAEEYKNRDSIIKCKCNAFGHEFEDTVTDMMRTNFQCFECFKYDAQHVKDKTPYFLALDAASYITGMSIFNRDGQLLGHQAFIIEKKKDFFTRVKELRDEIVRIVKQDNIKCVILEDIQYQQNPLLFKKLAMLQGVIRNTVINDLDICLISALPTEWRAYCHIEGNKRSEQKQAAIYKAKLIFDEDISEDESESIFLGYYGVYVYNQQQHQEED